MTNPNTQPTGGSRDGFTKQDDDACELHETEEVSCVILVTCDEPAEAHHPREKALDMPAALVAAEWPAILGETYSIGVMRRDHFDAEFRELSVERIAVVSFVANQAFGKRP